MELRIYFLAILILTATGSEQYGQFPNRTSYDLQNKHTPNPKTSSLVERQEKYIIFKGDIDMSYLWLQKPPNYFYLTPHYNINEVSELECLVLFVCINKCCIWRHGQEIGNNNRDYARPRKWHKQAQLTTPNSCHNNKWQTNRYSSVQCEPYEQHKS